MADLPNPPLLTADGDFDVAVTAGREYLLTVKGTWDGATITLSAEDPGLDSFVAVADGSWTANAEARLVPPGRLRFTVSTAGGSTSVSVTLIPIIK